MDFSEKWGKDVDTAVALALDELKCSIDDVNVIVLEEPSRGFLGLGSKLAKVRVELKKKEKVEPIIEKKIKISKPVVAEENKSEKVLNFAEKEDKEDLHKEKAEEKNHKKREKSVKKSGVKFERPDDLVLVEDHKALDFLKETTEKMGLELSFKAYVNDSNVYVDIEGKDAGTIIGKRGQTLDAIQYLTSLVVNKHNEGYVRVVLDAENYRAKREKTLEKLAERLSQKVIKTKRSVKLEPMNPYERMVIHATLHSNPKVITRSEGEEPYRRVVIELK